MNIQNRIKHIFLVHMQVFLYLFVGGVSFAADAGSFIAMYKFFMIPLYIATPMSLGIGLVCSFVLNKFFVFHKEAKPHHSFRKQVAMYVLLFAWNTVFSYEVIRIAIAHNIPPIAGKGAAMCMIICWNYFLYRKHIFKTTISLE